MSKELEEFLRRAAARRAAKSSGHQSSQQQSSPRQTNLRQSGTQQSGAHQSGRNQPGQQQQVRTLEYTDGLEEIVEAEVAAPPTGAEVSQHVSKHLDNKGFAERASHLGERAGFADDALQAHLHHAFDHKLGRLAGGTSSATAGDENAPSMPPMINVAQIFVDLLRNPQNVRSAVILNEILKRPFDD